MLFNVFTDKTISPIEVGIDLDNLFVYVFY